MEPQPQNLVLPKMQRFASVSALQPAALLELTIREVLLRPTMQAKVEEVEAEGGLLRLRSTALEALALRV